MNNYTDLSAAALSELAQKRALQQQTQKHISLTKQVQSTLSQQQYKAQSLADARAQALAAAQSINQQLMRQEAANPTINVTNTYTSNGQLATTTTTMNADQAALRQNNAEKEAEQKRLEEEMKKRRDRIEKWRKEKNKNNSAKSGDSSQASEQLLHQQQLAEQQNKKWNLEDDDEDEESQAKHEESTKTNGVSSLAQQTPPVLADLKRKASSADDEEDPLDAFMKEIYKKAPAKVAKLTATVKSTTVAPPTTQSAPKPSVEANKKVTIVMGVAKKENKPKEKGQIMESDIDGLEYADSEEDQEASATAAAASASSNDILLDPSLMMNKVKTKSEMVFTDHSKVYYRPFRKNFYVEVPELAKMTHEEVELYREELEGMCYLFIYLFFDLLK